ncbi:PRC-barrel domain protein [Synechococcus sp. PCC 7335]|uniref:DUF2382 domain-containing protein n=1 Tax=Synechococcus sp. (strain ATCC 29403 / PCC 7335) TaxID=91464 RepID=UPI00017ED8CE|nr:DUF2382 domain-containing protein [Synechococcus sp. PCC 7335]EDX84056.1 PRC-barrel domain protein [Synechococcus sp. PCC 7335]
MALVSLKNTYPDYKNTFSDNSLSHLDDYTVYADGDDKVGSVEDGLFDDTTGQFRYLIVDTGFWFFGKKVLLPIGRAKFDNAQKRVYVAGLSKGQVENLPEYNESTTVDYDYEENVRGIYRENAASQSAPVGAAGVASTAGTYTRDNYTYDRDPDLYAVDNTDTNQPIRLYEERLIADKNVVKTGDVVVGKRVEAETAKVSVPIEKERVVVERTTPTTTTAGTTAHDFAEGEVARVEVFEEQADIRKEAVVREEVSVRKEREQEVVSEEATIRREELDVDAGSSTVIDR